MPYNTVFNKYRQCLRKLYWLQITIKYATPARPHDYLQSNRYIYHACSFLTHPLRHFILSARKVVFVIIAAEASSIHRFAERSDSSSSVQHIIAFCTTSTSANVIQCPEIPSNQMTHLQCLYDVITVKSCT